MDVKIALLFLAIVKPGPATGDPRNVNWTGYGNDAAERRHSDLGQITVTNVRRPGLQWSLDLPSENALEGHQLWMSLDNVQNVIK